jgi:hypothetical protein
MPWHGDGVEMNKGMIYRVLRYKDIGIHLAIVLGVII